MPISMIGRTARGKIVIITTRNKTFWHRHLPHPRNFSSHPLIPLPLDAKRESLPNKPPSESNPIYLSPSSACIRAYHPKYPSCSSFVFNTIRISSVELYVKSLSVKSGWDTLAGMIVKERVLTDFVHGPLSGLSPLLCICFSSLPLDRL